MYTDVDSISGVVLKIWGLEGERWRWLGIHLIGGHLDQLLQSPGWDRGGREMTLVIDHHASHK
jgi:hypothetical protein